MNPLIQALFESENYKRILEDINSKKTPVLITGIIDVSSLLTVSAIKEELKRPAIIITSDELSAKELYEDMKFFEKDVMYYPAKDIVFFNADVKSNDIVKSRLNVINKILEGSKSTVIMSCEAIIDRLIKKETFEKHIFNIAVGDVFDKTDIMKCLVNMGYENVEIVEGVGQFASRGGILDIFTPIYESPIRIEFWDDEIDSIRFIDSVTQRSVEKTEEVRIFPVKEFVFSENEIEEAIQKIKKDYKKQNKIFIDNNNEEASKNLNEYVENILEKLSEKISFSGIENLIPYFADYEANFFDYLSDDTLIFFDSAQRIRERLTTLIDWFYDSVLSKTEKGHILPLQKNIVYDYENIVKFSEKFDRAVLTSITTRIYDFNFKDIIDLKTGLQPSFRQQLDLFADEIKNLKKQNYKTIIYIGADVRCQRLKEELSERGIEASVVNELNFKSVLPKTVTICLGKISRGFKYDEIKLSVFSEKDIFSEATKKRKERKKKKGKLIESFTDLKPGDYVVHDNHGIGVFRGIEKINASGVTKDYLKISYRDGGNLFVPVNQMDVIQKYIGSDSVKPKLNKLGGQDWVKAKAKVKSSVSEIAKDLVVLYAKRQSAKGFQFSKDNVWQQEFEETFPYNETNDQLNAIEDVKKDMESTKVMDRLICGDVGYGKTEVAIRAAFKAVQDGKQVAYLVPTTILAKQHYNNFKERMANYPVEVALLSRFRTAKQQKETIEEIKKGFVDIVIGTHRLLSKDISFKNLGLIIIDEEQRFGVAHKEKLKSLKENVDALALTATPIPRTLHMSLSGIRDMSILDEPPEERQPVMTYVLEESLEAVKDAINREISRGGQVYYLHNRVTNIEETTNKISALCPNAVVAYAHGQMSERELENIMSDFIEGEIDVLVCTTIIETGLDIQNVNTIIIQDADKMGLSQLYQLRGRVGRSSRVAYAYLMYRKDKVLLEIAEKRLQTIKEFTEFGSGFKVAMRDLEIRGAGSLLGVEQHGHIESVGYEMYCKLLDDAVKELNGTVEEEVFETLIDLNINAYIPDYYIKNETERLEIYKKISRITNKEEYYDVQEEIEDRFGNIPKTVNMLLDIVLLKSRAHELGVLSIAQKQYNIIITFNGNPNIDPLKLTKLISENKNKYFYTSAVNPYITIKLKEKDKPDIYEEAKYLIENLKEGDNNE